MNKPDNPPAFPSNPLGQNGMPNDNPQYGMTLRDYFASNSKVSWEAVIDTLKINKRLDKPTLGQVCEMMAEIRFMEADAMLAERIR